MTPSISRTGDESADGIPDRDGVLFSSGVTLADVYNASNREYKLYPTGFDPTRGRVHPTLRVAVIDSGILRDHPQISRFVVADRDWTGEGVEDRLGHGTLVAFGILYGPGIPDAKHPWPSGDEVQPAGLVVAKVAPADGGIPLRHVVAAIHWAAAQKVRFMNLSLGFLGEPKDFIKLKQAIEAYPEIMFFVAAGNYGPRIPVFPAAFRTRNMVVVGEDSTDSGNSEVVASTTRRPITSAQHTILQRQEEHFRRAMRAARENRAQEAKELFQNITAETGHPRAAEAWIQLGLYAAAEGDATTALERFAKAAGLSPAGPELHEVMGSVYFNQGDFPAAEKHYRASVALEPENIKVRYQLGLACLRQKKYRSALEQFEATFRLAPDHPDLEGILPQLRAAHQRGELPPE